MSGGSSDTEVNALAVIARMAPAAPVAITVTPVANWPTVWRNARESSMSGIDGGPFAGGQDDQRPPFLRTTLTSVGLIRSGAVHPSRLYSAMHCSANPLYRALAPVTSLTSKV